MKVIHLTDIHYGGKLTRSVLERFLQQVQTLLAGDSEIKAICITGDIASNKQSDISKFFKLYRQYLPSIPTLVVWGNHDYWDSDPPYPLKNPRMYWELRELHNSICNEFNVHYLENGSYKLEDVEFFGYDGWYNELNPNTNDIASSNYVNMRSFIETAPTHAYLNHRANKECDRVLTEAAKSTATKKVCLTHFFLAADTYDITYSKHVGIYRHLEYLSEVFDYILMGHSHEPLFMKVNECVLLNTGSCYIYPVGLIVDLNMMKCPLIKPKVIKVHNLKRPRESYCQIDFDQKYK